MRLPNRQRQSTSLGAIPPSSPGALDCRLETPDRAPQWQAAFVASLVR
jgi:hypothetical protein